MKKIIGKIKAALIATKKWVFEHKIISFLTLAAILGGMYYYQKQDAQETITPPETAKVQSGDIKIVVTGSGQVQAKNQVDLRPQAAGDGLDILEVKVKNDQEVEKGQIIAVLDSSDAKEKIRDAQLSLENAKLDLKSAEKKYKQTKENYEDDKVDKYDKKVSKYNRDSAQVNVQQKEVNLNNAYNDLSDYTIKAPFSGIVTGLSVEAGDSIARDETLASIITEELIAEISLNEIDAAQVQAGNQATLTFDALDGKTIIGTVFKIDTIGKVEQGVVSYNLEIEFDSFASDLNLLKPGMSVNTEIAIQEKKDVLQIPAAALVERNNKTFVRKITGTIPQTQEELTNFTQKRKSETKSNKSQSKNNQNQSKRFFEMVEVQTGLTDDVNMEIISGLDEGDKIITKMPTASSSTEKSSGKSLIPMGGKGMRK